MIKKPPDFVPQKDSESNLYFKKLGKTLGIRQVRTILLRKPIVFWKDDTLRAFINRQNDVYYFLKINGKKGRPWRIMEKPPEFAAPQGSQSNLFIKNLDKTITRADLREVFGKFGSIVLCKVQILIPPRSPSENKTAKGTQPSSSTCRQEDADTGGFF